MKGLNLTLMVGDILRGMSDGSTWEVTNCPSVVRRLADETLRGLERLGWVTVDRQGPLDKTDQTYVRLNETGLARAAEFVRIADANGSSGRRALLAATCPGRE
jgi:hypothetical protein